MAKYEVVSKNSVTTLVTSVQSKVTGGFQPVGRMVVHEVKDANGKVKSTMFYQTLYKP